jgi:hypothetical protein
MKETRRKMLAAEVFGVSHAALRRHHATTARKTDSSRLLLDLSRSVTTN